MIKRAVVVLSLCAGGAQADDAALMGFFETQACGIGDSSHAAAVAAGFDRKRISSWEKTLLIDGHAQFVSDWIVIGPEVCTIRFPEIESPLPFDGPIVAAATGPIDEFSAPSEFTGATFPGCYINNALIHEALAGFDDPTAAYLQWIGAGIVSGELRFYNDNILETPPSWQLTHGAGCDSVPNIPALEASHAVLLSDLDAVIRAVGPLNSCDGSGWPLNGTDVYDVIAPFHDNQTNAHFMFEIQLVAMAAGWIEGAGDGGRGTPRPPLCRYE